MTLVRKTIIYSALPISLSDSTCPPDADGDVILNELDPRLTTFDGLRVLFNANVPATKAARLLRKIADQVEVTHKPEPEVVYLPVTQ